MKDLALFARILTREVPDADSDSDAVVFLRKVRGLCQTCLVDDELSVALGETVRPERANELREALLLLKEKTSQGWRFIDANNVQRDLQSVARVLEEESEPELANVPTDQPPKKDDLWGNWQRQESIGSGGQGVAYRARNLQTGQLGALKVLDRAKIRDVRKAGKALERFCHELQSLQSIEHPCVLKVLDFDLEADEAWLVTEYLPLGSLDQALFALAGDAWRALRLARDVASGLSAAHANRIIHRDVKPRNILLRTLDHAILGDFGIAHILDATELTSTDEVVRARWYGPPEAENGRIENPAPSFDVYSLGKVIYVCLAGEDRNRFEREDFRSEKANLVSRLRRPELESANRLLDLMIVKEPSKRLQSMDEVVARIDETLGELFGCGPPDQCRVCRSGRYQTAPSQALRLSGGGNVVVWENPRGGDSPAVEICSTCGDIRLSATGKREAWLSTRPRKLA